MAADTSGDGREAVLEIRDQVAWIRLNRPERLNAMTNRLIAEAAEAVDEVERRDDVRALVMTGAGRGFCSGADRSTLFEKDEEGHGGLDHPAVQRLTGRIFRLPIPTIAAVNGPAAGAGFELALAFDIRLAAQTAFFQHAAMRNDLVAGDGSAFFLPRMIGLARGLELLLTERRVDAEEAHRIGLVSAVVDGAALEDRAQELALSIGGSRDTVAMTKEAVRLGLGASDPEPVFAYLRLAVARGRQAKG